MENFKLDEKSKIQTGFIAPENYFENLQSKIRNRIPEKEVKVISLYQKAKYLVASIAAIFIMGLFLNIFNNNSQENTMENEDFLTSQTDLSTEDLVEYLTETDIKTLETNLNGKNRESIAPIK
jgi:hypothetical protein